MNILVIQFLPEFWQLTNNQKVAIYESQEFRANVLVAAEFWLTSSQEYQARILAVE